MKRIVRTQDSNQHKHTNGDEEPSHQAVAAGVVHHPALLHHRGAFPLGVFDGLNHAHQRDVAARGRAARRQTKHRQQYERWKTPSIFDHSEFCFEPASPDGSERLVVLLALHEVEFVFRSGRLVLLVHAVASVAADVAVIDLHRGLGVQVGTGGLCRNTRSAVSEQTFPLSPNTPNQLTSVKVHLAQTVSGNFGGTSLVAVKFTI